MRFVPVLTLVFSSFLSLNAAAQMPASPPQKSLEYADETHFKNIRQLTFGGDNAEAYFGPDGKTVVFQRTAPKEGIPCDQIYYGRLPQKTSDSFRYHLVSTGKGRTTCSFIMPNKKAVLYASTHLASKECPPVPDRRDVKKYVWPVYGEYVFLLRI